MTSPAPPGTALSLWFDVQLEPALEATFTGCSGLAASREVVEWQEGGDNGTVIQLPGRLSYSNVVLTRVVDAQSGQIAAWFATQQDAPNRQPVTIRVFHGHGSAGSAVASWTLAEAWPVRYTGPTLATGHDGDAVAIETIELSHQGFTSGQ
jgi:phage tail-like protein